MNHAPPYPIPGPAGGLVLHHNRRPLDGTTNPSSSTRPQQPSTSTTDRFALPSWHAALHFLSTPPHGSTRLPASLALLRRNALAQSPDKLSKIPVLLDSMDWVGRDAKVILRDPTATICATIHASVFTKFPNGVVSVGSALVLNDVVAYAFTSRPSGFRMDPTAAIHLILCPAHVLKVLQSSDYSQPHPKDPISPAAIYQPFARNPPPLPRRPPPRVLRQASNTPRPPHVSNPAQPLAPHNGPQHRRPPPQQGQNPPSANGPPPSRKRPFSQASRPFRPPRQIAQKRPAFPPQRAQSTQQQTNNAHNVTPNCPFNYPSTTFPSHASDIRPHHANSNTNAASALSDEHLDSLLGDFDMDAAIAAHSQAAPPRTNDAETPPAPAHISAENSLTASNQEPLASQKTDSRDQTAQTEATTATQTTSELNSTQAPTASRQNINAKPSNNSPSPALAVSTASQPPSTQAPPTGPVAQPNTPSSDMKSSVDDDMIKNLFEGLDPSEFAE